MSVKYTQINLEKVNNIANHVANIITPKFTMVFNGELGVGKTTIIRNIIKNLGVYGNIKSPTYTLVESYKLKGLEIHHFDLYRFADKYEWVESGFDEYFTKNSILFIEWPSKAHGLIPDIDWAINITMVDDISRNFEIIALSSKGRECLKKLINQEDSF